MDRGDRGRDNVVAAVVLVPAFVAYAWWVCGQHDVSWPVRVAVSAAALATGVAAGVAAARRIRNGWGIRRGWRAGAGVVLLVVAFSALRVAAPVAGAMVMVAFMGFLAVVPSPARSGAALDRRDHPA